MIALFFANIGVGLAAYLCNGIIFESIRPSAWLILDLSIQFVFLLALSVFVTGKKRLLLFQFLFVSLLLGLNSLKIRWLLIPLIPSDTSLFQEAFQVLTNSQRNLLTIFVSGFLLLVFISFLYLLPSIQFPKLRSLGKLVPAFVFLFIIGNGCPIYTYFDSHVWGNHVLLSEKCKELGFFVFFSIEASRYLESAKSLPTKRDAQLAEQSLFSYSRIPASETNNLSGVKRNVYIIIAESFWKPSDVNFQGPNPTDEAPYLSTEFQKIWAQNGNRRMLIPVFGGGTANTEFEVLCGIPSPLIIDGVIFQTAIRSELNCLPRILREQGYYTVAAHSNRGGFYYRNVVYPALGFERFLDLSFFENEEKVGPRISDRALVRKTLEETKRSAGTRPFLMYVMTMAGHWPYHWSDQLYPKVFSIHGTGSDSRRLELEHHINLNYYTSELLAQFIENIKHEDPNSVLIVMGDHQPSLARSFSNKKIREQRDEDLSYYQVPLIITGKTDRTNSDVPAYNVANEILDKLNFPKSKRYHFPLMQLSGTDLIRPLSSGSVFVKTQNEVFNCSKLLTKEKCNTAVTWLEKVKTYSRYLILSSK